MKAGQEKKLTHQNLSEKEEAFTLIASIRRTVTSLLEQLLGISSQDAKVQRFSVLFGLANVNLYQAELQTAHWLLELSQCLEMTASTAPFDYSSAQVTANWMSRTLRGSGHAWNAVKTGVRMFTEAVARSSGLGLEAIWMESSSYAFDQSHVQPLNTSAQLVQDSPTGRSKSLTCFK
jgi:hypothetical protein